ncbi:hypothetical protein E2C01_101022 [Portunus trituberculatus]|uniref:Uncharacterized protein n=1 Tax=Portunus trituberculatus TaxID=210409 RepID=A0A5B7KJE9_PORTR|nr:hypothetical protein [Portunus trituberculatus]
MASFTHLPLLSPASPSSFTLTSQSSRWPACFIGAAPSCTSCSSSSSYLTHPAPRRNSELHLRRESTQQKSARYGDFSQNWRQAQPGNYTIREIAGGGATRRHHHHHHHDRHSHCRQQSRSNRPRILAHPRTAKIR